MGRFSLNILFSLILVAPFPLLGFALQFDIQPWQTDRPVPQSIIFFSATRAAGDPQFVNVILADTQRKNSTTLFDKHDLQATPNAGFRIPLGTPAGSAYVVQMADPSITPPRTLAQSPQFQIYPPGTPPSVSQTVTSTSAVLLDQTPSPMSTAQESDTPSASKLPVGAIAGGVVGGVFLIILFVGLLYCIRKQGKPLTAEELEKKKKLKEKNLISPFTMVQPTPIEHDIPMEAGGSTSSRPNRPSGSEATRFDTRNEKARLAHNIANNMDNYFTPNTIERLPTELTANSTIGESTSSSGSPRLRGTISSSSIDTSTSLIGNNSNKQHRRKRTREAHDTAAIARAQELRRERARLDKEISELERRTSLGGSRTPRRANNTDNDEMLAQLAALREQMELVEEQASQIVVPNEPPPDYYPTSLSPRH